MKFKGNDQLREESDSIGVGAKMTMRVRGGRDARTTTARGRGFTLIEVMISVALVLILTYGIAQVFKMSSDTVGVTQAVSAAVRDFRAASSTMQDDFRNCAPDSPLFLISSQVAYDGPVGSNPAPRQEVVDGRTINRGYFSGFKDKNEEMQSSDPNHDPTRYEVNGKQFFVNFNTYSDRTPRVDRLGFFARGLYRKQTTVNAQTYSTTTSNEAYIWYGPTAYPGYPAQSATIPQKGTAYANGYYMTIPHNQYAQDRILGRISILLKDASALTEAPGLGSTGFTAPIDWDSEAWLSYSDLGDSTIDRWRVLSDIRYQLNQKTWYQTMEDDSTNAGKMWWGNCQPVLERPITGQKLAQTAPCFIPHCTQFMVEYAGDFLAQDPTTGAVTSAGIRMDPVTGATTSGKTDGEIDYYLDTTTAGAGKPIKRIRWYGLPRDINNDGHIDISDVVPLCDVMDYYGIGGVAPWEKVRPAPKPTVNSPAKGPGLMSPALQGDYANFTTARNMSPQNFKYVCAWRNDAPQMIRIVMKLDDPTGKLQEGQWYEMVLTR